MPRKAREESGTGIFHVMMRGINHQNIFEAPEDYYQFIATLDRMRFRYDDEGTPSGSNCTYYAYCLMSNHFHLLIREREESVGETIKEDRGDRSASRGGVRMQVELLKVAGWRGDRSVA